MHEPTSAPGSAPASLEGLLEQRAWVRSLALVLTRDSNAADDLEQDTWTRAIEHPPARAGTPRAWLATVMRRLRSDGRRGEGRRRRREEAAARPEAQPAASDLAARAEAHRRVVDAVLALPPADRDLVLERWWEGREPTVIAARLGIPASTVRTRLARILDRLRAQLEERGGGAAGARASLLLLLAPDGDSLRGVADESTSGHDASCSPRAGWMKGGARLLGLGALLTVLAVGDVMLLDSLFDRATSTSQETSAPERLVASGRDGGTEGVQTPFISSSEVPAAPATHADATPVAEPVLPDPRSDYLTLTVRDEQGGAVSGAAVTLFYEAIGAKGTCTPLQGIVGRTDSDGTLRISFGRADLQSHVASEADAEPGRGRVVLSITDVLAGVADTVHLLAREGNLSALSGPIDPRANGGAVELVLLPSVTYGGRVVDERGVPVADAAVTLFVPTANDGNVAFPVTSDREGAFTIARCPPQRESEDDRSYRVTSPGYAERWVYLVPGGAGPVEVVLMRALEVRGRCVDREGRPVANVAVVADGVDGVWTDAQGRFVLPGLPAEVDEVRLFPDGHAARGVPLPSEVGAARDLGDLILEEGVSLRGIVVDERGAPVKGASLNLLALDVNQFVAFSGTDPEGAFLLEHLGPGEHELVVTAPAAGADGFGRRARVTGVRGGGEPMRIVVTAGLGVRLDFVDAVTGEPYKIRSLQVLVEPLSEGEKSNQGMNSDSGVTSMEIDLAQAGPHRITLTIPGHPPIQTTVTPLEDQGVSEQIKVHQLPSPR